MKKTHLAERFLRFFHRFARFTKQQKVFVLYLFVLTFGLLVLPIIKITPLNPNDNIHRFWLLNIHLFKTFLIIFASIVVLFAWNMSFQFKNFVIGYFGFKENDALVNFGFLWIIATAFLVVGDSISVVSTTQSVVVTVGYYILQIFLLLGLVLTLLSVIKHAKEHGNKTRIVNVVDEEAIKEVHNKQSLHGLFENE